MKMLEKDNKIFLLFPFIIYMIFFYFYGIFYGISTSFGYNTIGGISKFSLKNYFEIFNDNNLYTSILFTSRISLISGIISLTLSVAIIYLIYLNLKRKILFPTFFQKIIEAPLFVPYLVAAYGILILFIQKGVLSTLLINLNIISKYQDFPILTNDRFGTGIIITYVWKTIPFIVMMSLPVVRRIINKWEPLGLLYNMSDFKFFIKIILPLIFPTLIISFFIIFSYFIVAFETPYLLGVTYPKSLSVYIYELYSRGSLSNGGIIMGINLLISIFTLFIGYLAFKILNSLTKYSEKGWN